MKGWRYSNGNRVFARIGVFRSTSQKLEALAHVLDASHENLISDMLALAEVAKDPDGDRRPLIESIRLVHDLRPMTMWEQQELSFLIAMLEKGYEFAQ